MQLEIKGKIYDFRFTLGFLRGINKTASQPLLIGVKGSDVALGLNVYLTRIASGDIDALADMLMMANAQTDGEKLQREDLEAWIDSEECDIDEVIKQVYDALESSNATKKTTRMTLTDLGIRKPEKEKKK